MAAPIVIPAKTNPINDAIQYAGNSIKQAISLMQATKQLQVMEDANRVDAGKKLVDTAWNMFNTLANGDGTTPGVGGLAAFGQTRDLFASAFKALGMDDINIGNFAQNMSTGAPSYATSDRGPWNCWSTAKRGRSRTRLLMPSTGPSKPANDDLSSSCKGRSDSDSSCGSLCNDAWDKDGVS